MASTFAVLGNVEWVKQYLQRFPSLRRATDIEDKPFSLLAQQTGVRRLQSGLFAVEQQCLERGLYQGTPFSRAAIIYIQLSSRAKVIVRDADDITVEGPALPLDVKKQVPPRVQ
jgi:hypothetical protein